MMRTWRCDYCLGAVDGIDHPRECPHCHIGKCQHCFSWLSSESKWCYGCGKVGCRVDADFVDLDSTSSIYQLDNWVKRNISGCATATGPHTLSSGFCQRRGTWGHVWMRGDDGAERELNDDERIILGYRPMAEIVANEMGSGI